MCKREVAMLLATLLCLTGGACQPSDKPAKRLTIPTAKSVDRITVEDHEKRLEERPRKVLDFKPHVIVTDRTKIKQVVDILDRLNSEWRYPQWTFPGPQFTLCLERDGKLIHYAWIGPDWLGGRGDDDKDQLRSLSEKDRKELLDLLGIKEKATPKK